MGLLGREGSDRERSVSSQTWPLRLLLRKKIIPTLRPPPCGSLTESGMYVVFFLFSTLFQTGLKSREDSGVFPQEWTAAAMK